MEFDKILQVFTDEAVPDLEAVYIKGHLSAPEACAIAHKYLRHLMLCWEEDYCSNACLDHQDYCSCTPDGDWFLPYGEIQHGFGGFEFDEIDSGEENPLIFNYNYAPNANPLTRCPTIGYHQQQVRRREEERDARNLILTRVPNSCILEGAGTKRYKMQLCNPDTQERIESIFYIQIDAHDKLTASFTNEKTAALYKERINYKGE